ncbi:hypothetical protein FRC03_004923 [Tulasnella sp. 419]|nr:hypothetical protein FRC03_004923 [Tulasnella sp. 419]
METNNPVIEDEIQTISSIFDKEFQRESTKAWKGAASFPAFTLRITPDDPELKPHVFFTLHVLYNKTYPAAPATFTIKPPMAGLNQTHIKSLSNRIRDKAKELARHRQEMVFEIQLLCAEYIGSNHTYQRPSRLKETKSLAAEMKARAQQTEKELQELAEKQADGLRQQEEDRAHRLAHEMALDIQRKEQRLRAEDEKRKAREIHLRSESDDLTETFPTAVRLTDDVSFRTVKLHTPRQDALGKVFLADPVLDSPSTPISPLELHTFVFSSAYYGRSQGKKRLRDLQQELEDLIPLRHPNLSSTYYAEIKKVEENGQTLNILTDRTPSLTLRDVLEHCDSLRYDKAIDYLIQILSGLEALYNFKTTNGHEKIKYCHRSLEPECIGLVKSTSWKSGTHVVVGRAWYYGRLLQKHKSNPISGAIGLGNENAIPPGWCSREVEDTPHIYNQRRDIWDLGILTLQMLLGLNIMTRFATVGGAVESLNEVSLPDSLRDVINTMFDQTKRSNSTVSLLIKRLKEATTETPRDRERRRISFEDPRTPTAVSIPGRSLNGYFQTPMQDPSPIPRQASRWRDEWEEIEFLGKGGFGSVVKARFKLDGAIYAVKKIKLRGENDGRIFRETNALSKLSHRFIVRYHTTWIETDHTASGMESPADSGDSVSASSDHRHRKRGRPLGTARFRLDDLSIGAPSFSSAPPTSTATSFPTIHFGGDDDGFSDDDSDEESTDTEGDASKEGEDHDEDDDEDEDDSTPSEGTPGNSPSRKGKFLLGSPPAISVRKPSPTPWAPKILYIQMEYVERQTLREAIEDGLSEKEAWRLFRQILEALAHIANLGIIHRDIKLTNIFIGGNGDVKIGDFGLATSSLAAIDPSDVTNPTLQQQQQSIEMTSGVGTALYSAPEVLARSRGHASHAKADMYSLGIVFFEMNWPPFATATERVHVIQRLRLPSIIFPDEWEGKERQRNIITLLLQHNPALRPSAMELLNKNLLPEQEEDAYFEEARRKIHSSEEQTEAFISELFQKRLEEVKQLSYDIDAVPPEHVSLNDIVKEHVTKLFRLHGAVHKEPLLLVPLTDLWDDDQPTVNLLDNAGRALSLPRDLIIQFARSAISSRDDRIPIRVKRYHIGNTYYPSVTGKQPSTRLMAAVDIIHTDSVAGAAEAELMRIAYECLNLFPGVNTQTYDIFISHWAIIDELFGKTPLDREQQRDLVAIINQAKPWNQKRGLFLKLGLSRTTIEMMEILAEDVEDTIAVVTRLEKVAGPLPKIAAAMEDVNRTIRMAQLMGIRRPIAFRPLLMINQQQYKEGILFEIRNAKKGAEVIARGGRYDHLITKFACLTMKSMRAVGIQIALHVFTATLADHLRTSVPRLIKEQRSFGYWSPSRCNVYVVSFQPGLLEERIELVTMLWQNGISADLMYETAIENSGSDPVSYVETYSREGILFLVWYRAKSARRDHSMYKVKSLLKGTEYEVSPHDLVSFLKEQIAEQRRIDMTFGGGAASTAVAPSGSTLALSAMPSGAVASASPRETGSSTPNVQVILSGNDFGKRYQRNKQKIQLAEKAYGVESELRTAATAGHGIPVLAVEISPKGLDILTSTTTWVTSDSAWKSLLSEHKEDIPNAIAQQLREAILRRRAEDSGSHKFFGLISTKNDERLFMLRIPDRIT